MKRLRIVLVDDHRLVRAGIRSLLEERGMEVVAEASNGREGLDRVLEHRPDLVLMDISMPELNGLDALARIKEASEGTRVVILSMHEDEAYAKRAFLAGAAGYLLKDSAVDELGVALDTVSNGGFYLTPKVSTHLVRGLRAHAAQSTGIDALTPRQREVLQLIAEGHTNREIAAKLFVSTKTIETHRAQLMERLEIHDVAGLVRFAIRMGIVRSDQ